MSPEAARVPEPEPQATRCPLCRNPLRTADVRCSSCGLYRGLGEGRSFSVSGILLFFGAIAVLYLIALLVVLLAR